jgi:hypothetical protein
VRAIDAATRRLAGLETSAPAVDAVLLVTTGRRPEAAGDGEAAATGEHEAVPA